MFVSFNISIVSLLVLHVYTAWLEALSNDYSYSIVLLIVRRCVFFLVTLFHDHIMIISHDHIVFACLQNLMITVLPFIIFFIKL